MATTTQPENTLTADAVRGLTDEGLNMLAESIVFYRDTLPMIPDTGLYGDVEESLHVVALELNRRCDAASLQDDLMGAILTLGDFDRYLADTDNVNPQATWCAVRAAGCVLDQANEEHWIGLGWVGYSRESLTYFLQCHAEVEHQQRGYRVSVPSVARLVPADADALVAPF
jgi:hypothetical protein